MSQVMSSRAGVALDRRQHMGAGSQGGARGAHRAVLYPSIRLATFARWLIDGRAVTRGGLRSLLLATEGTARTETTGEMMNRWLSRLWLSAPLLLIGCNTTDPILCTEEFRFGINVEVVQASSGVPIAEDAVLILTDGEYVETITDSFDGRTLSGAGEREGTYTVTVTHDSFATWSRTGVVVTADECHVNPVTLRAELEPNA